MAKAKRLTPKQERFVQALVSGASQREAYLSAYNCGRIKPETVDSNASRLFADSRVAARYDELVAEAASRAVWDRERAIRETLEIRDIALEHIRATRGDQKNFTDKGARELADLPTVAAKLLVASTEQLNRLCGIKDEPSGDDRVIVIDDV